jgi:hypothetical protein
MLGKYSQIELLSWFHHSSSDRIAYRGWSYMVSFMLSIALIIRQKLAISYQTELTPPGRFRLQDDYPATTTPVMQCYCTTSHAAVMPSSTSTQ